MEIYIVEKGDTLEEISRKYNIPAIEIIKANNLRDPYMLTEGQSLTIPTEIYNIFDYYVVKKGDTLYELAKSNNTTIDILTGINGLDKDDYIYEGQTILLPKKDISLYITKAGDTIENVADFFKTVATDIVYSNNNIYLLPGQLITYTKT